MYYLSISQLRKCISSIRKKRRVEILLYSLLFLFMFGFVFSVRSSGNWSANVKNLRELHSSWTYVCSNSTCQRKRVATNVMTLATCNMMCGTVSLWPLPRSIKITNKNASTFDINQLVVRLDAPVAIKGDLKETLKIFKQNVPILKGEGVPHDFSNAEFRVQISVSRDERKLTLSSDESYRLKVVHNTNNSLLANIFAPTYFGARHALETLSQLIWLDTYTNQLKILHDIDIEDGPAFPYRGVMVDTARNFFNIKSLLKVVDGMAASKLNVLHLHLTDAVSFPISLPTLPELAIYGAYGEDKIYTPEDIKSLIEYARIRGIRTILEVDAPGHVNEGWNHLDRSNEKLVICGEEEVTSGQLNPDNPKVFEMLLNIYKDLLALGSDEEIFHIGGDEVDINCYAQTKASEIIGDPYHLWVQLTNQIFKNVVKAHANKTPKHIVLWSSPLTNQFMSNLNYGKHLVIQYWLGELYPIVENGNKIIFSTVGKWYLDCGFGSWKVEVNEGSCDPYTPWQVFYKYRPWRENAIPTEQVLGGEACLWTEQVNEATLETRLWPRAAAFAERVWTDPEIFDSYDVSTRLSTHKDRLISRGIEVAAIWPLWCTQNPGKCSRPVQDI